MNGVVFIHSEREREREMRDGKGPRAGTQTRVSLSTCRRTCRLFFSLGYIYVYIMLRVLPEYRK